MQIQLIDSLDHNRLPAVAWQIDQVKKGVSDELFIATPHENSVGICEELGLPLEKVVDMASRKRLSEIPAGDGYFLDDLKVANDGQRVFENDGTVSLVTCGRRIASVVLFSGSSYLVQAVSWLNQAGQVTRKDIYQKNGQLFCKQFYNRGSLLESDYFFGEEKAVVKDYYYNNRRNFSIVFGEEYPSFEAGLQDYLSASASTAEVVVTDSNRLSTLGQNMVLACPDGVFDQNGKVLPDVLMMMENDQHPVKTIWASGSDLTRLASQNLPMDKIKKHDF
ncbi:hypothetical protein G6R29_02260 [Fructobacillus sp. M2-14]|uniref:Uncharacterized protein n=1 Tax=Fructobacillus broussonetiae TaxID=2713173 RepID=A0ABS5R1F5_9LACO|nr:hypothetical protein [Fructobacillus broussonetiae]MBS9338461.1 hypothetical protein [Fructobacillus broussonetiae]